MISPQHLLASISPVALISACGLIMLALYNRLSAIHIRIRTFHQQKLELIGRSERDQSSESAQTLLNLIDSQIAKVTVKAKAVQQGLYYLLATVLAFLVCSILVTASAIIPSLMFTAIGMQILGLILFAAGIGWAIQELTLSLTPLEEESAYLEILTMHHQSRTGGSSEIRVAKAS